MQPDSNGQAAALGVHVQPTADVDERAELGDGTRVWHLAQIRENARIGRGCIIGRGAYVGPGVVRPRFSCTTGPVGKSLRIGVAPRPFGIVLHTRLALSLVHSHGRPKMPFSPMSATCFAFAVLTSTIHKLSPAFVLLSLLFTK